MLPSPKWSTAQTNERSTHNYSLLGSSISRRNICISSVSTELIPVKFSLLWNSILLVVVDRSLSSLAVWVGIVNSYCVLRESTSEMPHLRSSDDCGCWMGVVQSSGPSNGKRSSWLATDYKISKSQGPSVNELVSHPSLHAKWVRERCIFFMHDYYIII